MKMKWILCSGLVGLALLLLPQQGRALTFSVDSATVNVNDIFSINVHVADAVDLTSWQFDLGYNPTLLQAQLVTEGPFLASFGTTLFPPTVFTPGIINNSSGLISLVANAFADLPPLPSGSGVLARIQFKALTAGLSPLTLSGTYLNLDPNGFTVANGSVCVTGGTSCGGGAVPEPSSLWLMGLGAIAFWGMRRWSQDGAAAIL
jgi:Cohesin domain/PEP-CTERM motif